MKIPTWKGKLFSFFIIITSCFFLLSCSLKPPVENKKVLENGYVEGDFITSSHLTFHYYFYKRGTDFIMVDFHGGPGHGSAIFRGSVGKLLADEVGSTLYVDQRGTGLSQREGFLPSSVGFSQEVKDMHEIIMGIIGKKNIVIMGRSFGGNLALHYALTYPNHAKAYIFSAPYLYGRLYGKANTKDYEIVYAELNESKKIDTDRINGDVVAAWYKNETLGEKNYLPLLPFIHVPTLILLGKHDYIVGKTLGNQMKLYLPEGQYIYFDNSAHKPYIFYPNEYVDAIKKFMNKLGYKR